MDIGLVIQKVLLEDVNAQIQQLKDKNVGEGKPLSEEDFKKIEEVASGKWYLVAWLTKKVASKIIKNEDIYKWKEYFQIYEKNKNKFQHKDINLYKTPEDISNFIETVIQIREGDVQYEDLPQSDSFLSKNEIEKLTSGGDNKYLGIYKPEKKVNNFSSDGYQVFQITQPTQQNWKVYRDLLGRCKGRERGAKIEICTIAHFSYFKDYLKTYKGSSYIVLFSLKDPMSPYQLHLESDQFMNKNDATRYNFSENEFYEWLSKKSEYYNPKKMAGHLGWEIPFEDKGFKNEKGKQGIWVEYDEDLPSSMTTYKDNKVNGPYITFFGNGKIDERGTKIGNTRVGDFEEYYYEGDLRMKGTFDNAGQRIGVWKFGSQSSFFDFYLQNYDDSSMPISGITKSGKLKFISDREYNGEPAGKTVWFYPSGNPKAVGTYTTTGKKTGSWTLFFPNGTIKLEGNFRNDRASGEWRFFFNHEGTDYFYEVNFDEYPKIGKLYTKDGQFLKKKHYNSGKIPSIHSFFIF